MQRKYKKQSDIDARSPRIMGMRYDSKEFKFCEAKVQGLTNIQAAKAAGYTRPSSAAQTILAKPNVRAYLQNQFEAARAATRITRDDVLCGLQAAIHDAKLLSEPSSQIAGWREIARILGYYEPEKKEITLTIKQETTRKELEVMAEDELLRLAGDGGEDVVDADFDFIPAKKTIN